MAGTVLCCLAEQRAWRERGERALQSELDRRRFWEGLGRRSSGGAGDRAHGRRFSLFSRKPRPGSAGLEPGLKMTEISTALTEINIALRRRGEERRRGGGETYTQIFSGVSLPVTPE